LSAPHVILPEDGSNQRWDRSLKPGFLEKNDPSTYLPPKLTVDWPEKNYISGALKYFFNVHSHLWKKSNLASIYFRWVET